MPDKSGISELLFVYGTLKQGHVSHYMLHGAVGIQAYAPDIVLYRGPGYPLAKDGNGKVYGELYKVDEAILRDLDEYEEAPGIYVRVQRSIVLDTGELVPAWIYLSHKTGAYPVIESGIWLKEFEL